jgi:2-polyprenyl-3-methyl-5-hydroxy-6-metoxy-1,4-benzoquinol methylase
MPVSVQCNLCPSPGTLAGASEVFQVPCNVRRFQQDVFTLWRCNSCGSLHCKEDADLDYYYSSYPLKNHKLSFSERIGYANRLKRLERQGLDQSHRILDYGCGAGLFLEFLRTHGYPNVSGYDAFVPNFQSSSTLETTYDAVVSYDVIEHDNDPRAFIARLGALVRAGGLLVIGTPNADRIPVARKGDPNLHPPYHRHILSEAVLLALGQGQDLHPVDIYRRSFYDSLVPTVNSRFMWRYVEKCQLDAVVEPPRTGLVLRSPDLLFFAFFGYFMPLGDNILVTFRKQPQGLAG